MRWIWLVIVVAACGDKAATEVNNGSGSAVAPKPPLDRDALFAGVPTSKAVAGVIGRLSAKPHVAGSRGDAEVADEIQQTLGRMGWKTGEARYDVYLPHPKKLAIQIVGGDAVATTEPEAAKLGDAPMLYAWNAYSASGKVTAPIVDGTKDGVVKGAIVVAPYRAGYRGAQVAALERAGAVAVIFYVDPKDDPKRSPDSVQRGTVSYTWNYPGDPLTPGVAAAKDAKRIAVTDAAVLPTIPVVNVTATEATKLVAAATAHQRVTVEVVMDNQTRPIRDVLAFFPGTCEQAVILGNHYDAWGYGALDPHAGTAAMIEIARGIAALAKAGWHPKRTIVLGFWDAQEFGMIGSTEWVEDQLPMLTKSAVAYFDIDAITAGELQIEGGPTLHRFLASCAGSIENPTTKRPFAPAFANLGIGTDATAFVHRAGVESVHWTTKPGGPGESHAWHSILDDAAHLRADSDPDLAFIPAVARAMGTCAIRLADAEELPIEPADNARWIRAQLGDAVVHGDALDEALAKLEAVGTKHCDAQLIAAQRAFLVDDGVAGRPWFRNLLIGGEENGAAVPLPELAGAKDAAGKTRAIERLVAAIDRAANTLASCGK